MVAFRGHFDGHVIIPDGQLSLPRDRELVFSVGSNLPLGVSGKALLELIDSIGFDKDSAGEIADTIEKDCEQIDGEW